MVDKAKAANDSSLTFKSDLILDEDIYKRMSELRLVSDDADEVPVVPVRNKVAPHFRRLAKPTFIVPIQAPERDVTHSECIAQLMKAFRERSLAISTTIFGDRELSVPTSEQALLGPLAIGEYQWWDDTGGTRIPVGNGRYIQPDICGTPTKPSSFYPSSRTPRVIIEVIQTHPPEPETLLNLLSLSEQNHLVVLYFVKPGSSTTRYSQTQTWKRGEVRVRAAHYLLGRRVLRNGVALGQTKEDPLAGAAPYEQSAYDDWYRLTFKPFIDQVMRDKNADPPSKMAADTAD